ncbi:hypothetical protein [Spirosoma montaniterrae]|uniref:Uncharacterized protein n=1 Tax=Spirosoma montaniterrae TaxID=1178516 RepID=A0A1P9WX43_9BACT|nr:hypothetical protein [Spirosoma montaniterrae]AQG79941.1 hypothetical protein AWR27_11765 [Spirosoma montaniterrae]
MATVSPFDPNKVDPEFYSQDPSQHGDSDYGRESEGVGNQQTGTTSGMDQDTNTRNMVAETREANVGEGSVDTPKGESLGTTQEWDVNPEAVKNDDTSEPSRMISDEAAAKLDSVAENPSDDALFHRADATYLEEGDDPNQGYDPHNKGYDNKDKENPK